MVRTYSSSRRIRAACKLVFTALIVWVGVSINLHADQAAAPDTTPQIQQISPKQVVAGSHVTITITGSNFAPAALISSVSNAIHIDSYKRLNDAQFEVQLSVSNSAPAGAASLLLSNPSGSAAEAAVSIVEANSAPAQNADQSKSPSPPAAADQPAKPQSPAPPAAPQTVPDTNPAPQATPQTPPATPTTPPPAAENPAAPQTPAAPAEPVEAPGPEVSSVVPPRLGQGFDIDLRVSGKNFVKGTKVSFANSGIRIAGIASTSSTEITVHIKVSGDAPVGKTSLYVINPDDSEAEFPIEVALKGTLAPTPAIPRSPDTPEVGDPSSIQRFDAFHLGNPTEIFHTHGKVKGSLIIADGTVKYQEDKQTLINISLSEIKEVKTSGIGGVNIKLNSGKTHHFAASSLKGSDARTIVDAIQKAMPAPTAN